MFIWNKDKDKDKHEKGVIVGEDTVAIKQSNDNIVELIRARLERFMLVTIISGLILCLALGFEVIQIQGVVLQTHDLVSQTKAQVAQRAAQSLNQRNASCAYTKSFVNAFHRFEANQAIANQLEPTTTSFEKARLYAFDTLFGDLDKLGANACKGTP